MLGGFQSSPTLDQVGDCSEKSLKLMSDDTRKAGRTQRLAALREPGHHRLDGCRHCSLGCLKFHVRCGDRLKRTAGRGPKIQTPN